MTLKNTLTTQTVATNLSKNIYMYILKSNQLQKYAEITQNIIKILCLHFIGINL